jgi:mono/diheme cytochrome c family protein
MKKLLSLSILAISLFASEGQKLFEQKCTACHNITPPSTMSERQNIVAPPIGNVLYHLDMEFKTADAIKKHIVEFTLNPTKEKAICNSVKRFGLMPSQKESVTKAELEKIADFLTQVIAYTRNSHANKGKGGCNSGACSSKGNNSCSSKGGGCGGGCSTKR